MNTILSSILLWILCGWILTAIIMMIGSIIEDLFPNLFGEFFYKMSVLFGGPVTWGVIYLAKIE